MFFFVSANIMKLILSCIIIPLLCYKLQFSFASSNSCFDVICIPSDYCKMTRPPPKNETTNVLVSFQKIQILNIDESESTITLKLAIAMGWPDPRIFISVNATEEYLEYIKWPDFKSLPKEFVNHLWLPDAYIPHVQKISKYNFINDFEGYGYTSWQNESQIHIGYRIEVQITLYCKMNFEAYPMDENTCYFTLGSYAPLKQSAQNFSLLMKDNYHPVKFDASKQVAKLDFMIDVKEGLPKHNEKLKDDHYYQRTGFEIKIQRKVTGYITSYYVPSGILVVLSWVRKKNYIHNINHHCDKVMN